MEPGGLASTVDSIWYLHQENVRRTLVKLTRDADLADDLAQETYLRARAGFAHCRGENDLAWLRSIARNVCYSHMRRAWVHAETPLDEEVDGAGILDAGSGSHLSELHLNGALSALPAPLRTALRMRYESGYSYAEIAESSEISLRTAKWRVKKGTFLLRSFLYAPESDGTTCAELTTARLLDYLYRLLPPGRHLTTRSHLGDCPHCAAALSGLRQLMLDLELRCGGSKQMQCIDLGSDGLPRLDVLSSHVNLADEPEDHILFYARAQSSLKSLAVPGKPLCHKVSPSGRWPDRLKYTARLPYLILPGRSIETRCAYGRVQDRPAKRIDRNTFRFAWQQVPNNERGTHYAQVLRLPMGAELLACQPSPSTVTVSDQTTIAWHSHLSPAERFRSCIEYRLR